MAVTPDAIKFYHCANRPPGVSETNPNYGGYSVTDELATDILLHNLFDRIEAQQAADGYTDHRKLFIAQVNIFDVASSSILYCPVALIRSSNETWYFRKYTGAALSNVLSDVSSLPNSAFPMSFNEAQEPEDGLFLGNLPSQGQVSVAIWIRRVIAAGCGSAANEGTILRVRWETA